MIEILRDQRFLIGLGIIGIILLLWWISPKNSVNDFDSLKTEKESADNFLNSQIESDHFIKNVEGGGRNNWWKDTLGGEPQLASEGGKIEEIDSSLGEAPVRSTGFIEGIPQVWTAQGNHLTRIGGCDQII